MTGTRIAGVALLVLLGVGVLSRITDHAPPKNPDRAPVQICADGELLATETVDLTNGNLHLKIPIPTAHPKPTAPRSGH